MKTNLHTKRLSGLVPLEVNVTKLTSAVLDQWSISGTQIHGSRFHGDRPGHKIPLVWFQPGSTRSLVYIAVVRQCRPGGEETKHKVYLSKFEGENLPCNRIIMCLRLTRQSPPPFCFAHIISSVISVLFSSAATGACWRRHWFCPITATPTSCSEHEAGKTSAGEHEMRKRTEPKWAVCDGRLKSKLKWITAAECLRSDRKLKKDILCLYTQRQNTNANREDKLFSWPWLCIYLYTYSFLICVWVMQSHNLSPSECWVNVTVCSSSNSGAPVSLVSKVGSEATRCCSDLCRCHREERKLRVESELGAFLFCWVWMFSLCLCRFSAGSPAFSNSPKWWVELGTRYWS